MMRFSDLRDIGIVTLDKDEESLFFLITKWYLLDIWAFFQQFLICGGTFQDSSIELAHFRNSRLVVAHFRNS